MDKEQVAEKLGWKKQVKSDMYKMGVVHLTTWISLNGERYNEELPDWENSLDAQVRDIWPCLCEKGVVGIWVETCAIDKNGETPAQACWKVICEVLSGTH